jgi:hypothetical protein
MPRSRKTRETIVNSCEKEHEEKDRKWLFDKQIEADKCRKYLSICSGRWRQRSSTWHISHAVRESDETIIPSTSQVLDHPTFQ